MGINATESGYLDHPPVEFRVGQTGLKIHLVSAARFRAQIQLDSPDLAQGLLLLMERTDAPAAAKQEVQQLYGRTGDSPWNQNAVRQAPRRASKKRIPFTWDSLAPGVYSLTIRCIGYSQALAIIDGIQLRARRLNTDRRLRPYDLRGKFHAIELTIEDPNGKPLRSNYGRPPLLFVERPKSSGPLFAYVIPPNRKLTVAAVELPIRVLVSGRPATRFEWFVFEWIEGISASRTIRLREKPSLRVKLRGGPRRLPGGRVLSVWLRGVSLLGIDRDATLRFGGYFDRARGHIPAGASTTLRPDGSGELSLPCAGMYNVSFQLQEDRKDWWKGKVIYIKTSTQSSLNITDPAATVELDLPQAAIDAAVKSARR